MFKQGDRSDKYNYRLISILPSVSKVIERFGHFQLYGHLIITQNNLLFDKQFALDNVATTATAFCQFTDDLPVVCAADWCEEIAQGIRRCLSGIVLHRCQIDG